MLDSKFRLFPEIPLAHSSPLQSFGSFRHRFGKAPLTETASAFSVCSSAPSGLGNRKGREDEDEVGQGKGYGEGAGSRLRTPGSRGGKSEGKEGPISWMA